MVKPNIKSDKKYRNALLIKTIAVFVPLMCSGWISAQERGATSTPQQRYSNQLYFRAPDVMPGTLPEMRDANYWIDRMEHPDDVVMSLSEIKYKNVQFHNRLDTLDHLDSNLRRQILIELRTRPGLLASVHDLDKRPSTELETMVRDMIDKEIKFLKNGRWGNILGIRYSDREIESIENEISTAKEKGKITRISAITVNDCRLRIIPSLKDEYVGYSGLAAWDMWNLDIIPIGSAVTVLSRSRSGRFLFILCKRGLGWVNSEEIAVGSATQISGFTNSNDFVVCTGDKVPFYSDKELKYASGYLRMGDRVPASSIGGFVSLLIPTRGIDGKLVIQTGWSRRDADFHFGYLPFTRRNVVKQSFKLLDNIYDWTGGWFGRDHATQLRDIFSVFGFEFPSMGGLLSAYNMDSIVLKPEVGKQGQFNAILSHQPFLTLQICSSGHSQLFLGDYNGVPIVFDTHGYNYKDDNGNEFMIRRANVGTVLLPDYFLKQEIRFVDLDERFY